MRPVNGPGACTSVFRGIFGVSSSFDISRVLPSHFLEHPRWHASPHDIQLPFTNWYSVADIYTSCWCQSTWYWFLHAHTSITCCRHKLELDGSVVAGGGCPAASHAWINEKMTSQRSVCVWGDPPLCASTYGTPWCTIIIVIKYRMTDMRYHNSIRCCICWIINILLHSNNHTDLHDCSWWAWLVSFSLAAVYARLHSSVAYVSRMNRTVNCTVTVHNPLLDS